MSIPTGVATVGHTILVIDDEPQIRRVVQNAFADLGYAVTEAASGAARWRCAVS